MELRPGAVIAGRYRIDRKIGSGGMGEVWAGENVAIGVRVALKTLLPAAALDAQIVARFRREAQLLGRLRSDRVARVVDFIEDRQVGLCLVMDYVEGELLGDVLLARRLGIEEALDVGVDIVSALCDLHRARVVHRDLKPDNIILEPLPGGGGRAVIVDLGVSRLDAGPSSEEMTSITQVDTAVGTLPYMAPEQLLSSSTATASADVYAVGAILFRAVSGDQVFGDDDGLAARRKLSGEAPPLSLRRVDRLATGLTAVVARALRRHPEERFSSAEAMLRELTALQDLARATALDLDANTEEALPPSALALARARRPRPRRRTRGGDPRPRRPRPVAPSRSCPLRRDLGRGHPADVTPPRGARRRLRRGGDPALPGLARPAPLRRGSPRAPVRPPPLACLRAAFAVPGAVPATVAPCAPAPCPRPCTWRRPPPVVRRRRPPARTHRLSSPTIATRRPSRRGSPAAHRRTVRSRPAAMPTSSSLTLAAHWSPRPARSTDTPRRQSPRNRRLSRVDTG